MDIWVCFCVVVGFGLTLGGNSGDQILFGLALMIMGHEL
jgi:hypothetical protein